jgi:hypothetical protein
MTDEKKSRHFTVGVLIVLVIGILIHLNTRHSADSPGHHAVAAQLAQNPQEEPAIHSSGIPPMGEPLVASYETLSALAKSGNAAAAKRLFEDAQQCININGLSAEKQGLQKNRDILVNSPEYFKLDGEVNRKRREASIAQIDSNIQRADSAPILCQNSDGKLGAGQIYGMAQRAAELGDDDAAACLVAAPFKSAPVTPEQGNQYRADAYRLANLAVAHGNWNAVSALAMAYGGSQGGEGLGSYIPQKNPTAEYKYTKLMRLGAIDGSPDAAQLDRQLAGMAADVPNANLNSADQWANETYKNSFFYSGVSTPYALPCQL